MPKYRYASLPREILEFCRQILVRPKSKIPIVEKGWNTECGSYRMLERMLWFVTDDGLADFMDSLYIFLFQSFYFEFQQLYRLQPMTKIEGFKYQASDG